MSKSRPFQPQLFNSNIKNFFAKERSKAANYSNPSDYVRSLIREDQRRVAAEAILNEMMANLLASNPATSRAQLEKLRGEFWAQWSELRAMIDAGIISLDRGEGSELSTDLMEGIMRRGRERLTKAKAV